jgi:23S rRNA pseudouridine1911/1915/1917 synthase
MGGKPITMADDDLADGDDAERIEGTVPPGERLDKALSHASGLSRERIKALIADGAIMLNGKAVTSGSAKAASESPFAIAVPAPAPAQAVPQDIPINVVFEDEHLIIVDKPAGMVVHPAAGNPDGTLVNALLHHCAGHLSGIGGVARPGIVHRIDKDTSGLLVAAKTDLAHEGLARQFADHSIDRAYRAVVRGQPIPAAGTIEGRIGRSSKDRKKMAVLDDNDTRGKNAITHFRTMKLLTGATLVECTLETGRTHQIRVHMSSIGHALIGDPVYGRSDSRFRPILNRLSFHRQALHAAMLGFTHPASDKRIQFYSEIPHDMAELIDTLARR